MKQVEVNKEVRNSIELLFMFRFQYTLFYKKKKKKTLKNLNRKEDVEF